MKQISIKTQLIFFLVILFVFLFLKDRDLTFLFATLISLASAISLDLFLSYFKNKKFFISESSIISGLIIGFVIASDSYWWVIALTAVFAIFSKHFIFINKKHIFNPAGFGIFLSTILLGANTQWKGTYLWYILVPVGLYFVYRIRKIGLVVSYFITAIIFFCIQAVLNKTQLMGIFGYFSYFYIFIMLIEPKTTPNKTLAKIIFGASVAGLIFIFTQIGVKFDAELAALLILNIFVPLLNKIPERSFK